MPTPCTRFPEGSSTRLESRGGVEISKREGVEFLRFPSYNVASQAERKKIERR